MLDGSDDDSPTHVVRLPTPNAVGLAYELIDPSLLDESIWTDSDLNDSTLCDEAVYGIKNTTASLAENTLIDE
jgi:hypothetical protein